MMARKSLAIGTIGIMGLAGGRRWLRRYLFAVISTVAMSASAEAGIILTSDASLNSLGAAQDGFNITRDTTNNLDWLDMTLTTNRSFNQVTSTLLQSGGLLDGWRHATAAEVVNFGISAGVPSSYFDPISSAAAPIPANANLDALLAALGKTLNAPNIQEIYFITAESRAVGTHAVGEIRIDPIPNDGSVFRNWLVTTSTPSTVIGNFNRGDSASPGTSVGHALVRAAPSSIPEPSTLFVLGFGLLGLGLMRRPRDSSERA